MSQLSPSQISDAFKQAVAAFDSGQLDAALAGFDAILAAKPGLAEALFQKGRVLAEMGELDGAEAAFRAALVQHPREAAIWSELALVLGQRGDGKAGSRLVKEAVAAGLPAEATAILGDLTTGRGAALRSLGGATPKDVKAARGGAALAQLAQRFPKGAVIWAQLAEAHLAAGQLAQAEGALRKALALEPMASAPRSRLAGVLATLGKRGPALAEARRAAHLAPRGIEAQLGLARIAQGLGVDGMARSALARAAALAPKDPRVALLRAQMALTDGHPDAALALLAPFEKRGSAEVLGVLAKAQAGCAQDDAALETYARAIRAAGSVGRAPLAVARAQLLQSTGRRDEAEAELRAVIDQAPGMGLAYRALAYGTRLAADDPVVTAMEAQLARADLLPEDRRMIHFAMARAMETSGQPDRVFDYLHPAKAASFAAYPYNATADQDQIARTRGPLTQALEGLPPCPSEAAPIFVTGMPRSGTTLVERIIAAHSAVTAGGELGVLSSVARDVIAALEAGEPVAAPEMARAAQAYCDQVQARTGATGRVTDKSIHSFVHIGVIRKLLPKARIVVVHRDPRDTGFSIYRNHFPDGTHRYTNDLDAIAAHYEVFQTMVDHWRAMLPAGAFHEIRYEELLADPEGQSRALIDACGLPWEDACLSFHERAGRVDTLSFEQVRRPINSDSVGGWQRYEAELAPLIAGLRARGLL